MKTISVLLLLALLSACGVDGYVPPAPGATVRCYPTPLGGLSCG